MKNMDDINENTHQWYEIELEDGRKIKITGNHNVFIPEIECYRRVDELTGDEEFLID
jgi:intein/homing endonuclease